MHILVVNCGSSSLKFQLIALPSERVAAKGLVERIGQAVNAQFRYTAGEKDFPKKAVKAPDHSAAIQQVITALVEGETAVLKAKSDIVAFGHRVVHGGEQFSDSQLIDAPVMKAIKQCCELAPLHNPANLAGICACQEALPGVPNVAVFDTAFHQTMQPHAFHYALPPRYYEKLHIRRYGFHGTSHKYVTHKFAEVQKKTPDEVNLITCHLGNGSSLAAVQNGRSVDTSMGFTPLQGVIMGTRSGDIDPAVVFYLIEQGGMTVDAVNDLLNKKSGLLGFSGVSSDMRDILAAVDAGNERAALALNMCAYGIAKYVGAYHAILPRTDAIVFTAGIGENSGPVRAAVCAHLAGIGVALDDGRNMAHRGIGPVSSPSSRIPVWVIPTNEELMIARETYNLMQARP